MHAFLICNRCDWIDYLEENINRCPECGSRTESVENLFAGETITCTVSSVARRKTKVTITFEMFTERFNQIITDKSVDDLFDTEFDRGRINLMMRAYIWLLLKRHPQLWLNVNLAIKGLKELITLNMIKQVK